MNNKLQIYKYFNYLISSHEYIIILKWSEFKDDDTIIASHLNIDGPTYIELLKKYGAHKNSNNIQYYFFSKEDAEAFLDSEELEILLVMGELTK